MKHGLSSFDHLLEEAALLLPLLERGELHHLLLALAQAVRHARRTNRVVVERVDVGEGDNLQVVRVRVRVGLG